VDWIKNMLGMAGAYTIARTFLDHDAEKRAQEQFAWEAGHQLESLVSDIDDVIVDELNAAITQPDVGEKVMAWAARAEPKLRRYRVRFDTWWGRSPEGDELIERWQTALDGYIEAIVLIRAEGLAGVNRLEQARRDYTEFQAWLRSGAIALGWKPEE
jgi:hypothetical protein